MAIVATRRNWFVGAVQRRGCAEGKADVAGGSNDRHVLCNGDMSNLRHHGLLRGVFNPHPAACFQSLRMVDPRQLHGVCHSVWFCLPTYVCRLDQPIPSCFTTSTIASSSMMGLEPFIA